MMRQGRILAGAAALVAVIVVGGCAAPESDPFDTSIDTHADGTDTTDAWDTAPTDGVDGTDGTDAADTPADDGTDAPIYCSTNGDCANGLYCDGVEICLYGYCQPGTPVNCVDVVDCTVDRCDEDTDSCAHVPDDGACDDGNPCDGPETCSATLGCRPGTAPDCSDGVRCTLDTCNTSTGECEHSDPGDAACDDGNACTVDACDVTADTCSSTLIDGDGDGVPPASCGGPDCNDADAAINPGAAEVCGDGVDQDCDGLDGDTGTCECPVDVSAGGTFTGDTTTGASLYEGSCGYAYYYYSPEIVHRLVLAAAATVTLETYGSVYDTILYVKDSPCSTGTELYCDDDGGVGVDSYLSIPLAAGTYFVFVDGYDGDEGAYTLTVTITPT